MRRILQRFKLCRAQSQETSFKSRLASNCVAMRLNTEKQAIERGMMGRAKRQSVSPIIATSIALAPPVRPSNAVFPGVTNLYDDGPIFRDQISEGLR